MAKAMGGILAAVVTAVILYKLINGPGALLGPRPTPVPPTPTPVIVPVPNLVGLDFFDANLALIQTGLFPQFLSDTGTATPACAVVRTDPAAGTRLTAGSRVKVFVAPARGQVPQCPGLPAQ